MQRCEYVAEHPVLDEALSTEFAQQREGSRRWWSSRGFAVRLSGRTSRSAADSARAKATRCLMAAGELGREVAEGDRKADSSISSERDISRSGVPPSDLERQPRCSRPAVSIGSRLS